MRYVYECRTCGKRHEKRQPITDEADPSCPLCDGKDSFRIMFPAQVIFKGHGFYSTDKAYRQNVEEEPWTKNHMNHRTG